MGTEVRRLMIVIEGSGDNFNFHLAGDVDRLEDTPPNELSAAEFWAVEFLKACHDKLENSKQVKKLNREERRLQK